jgi:hypothetical protein
MTTAATDLPGTTTPGSEADRPTDRDERRIRVMVDALTKAVGPDTALEDDARTAALRALLDYGSVAASQRGAADPR